MQTAQNTLEYNSSIELNFSQHIILFCNNQQLFYVYSQALIRYFERVLLGQLHVCTHM